VAKRLDKISAAHLSTGRAVDQLRRQLGIVFEENNGRLLGACPIEGLTPAAFSSLPKKQLRLLLTGTRARHIGLITNAARVACIDVGKLPLQTLQALADPLLKPKKFAKIKTVETRPSHETLMTLAKYASLLPAMLIVKAKTFPKDWLRVSAADVAKYWADPPLDMVKLVETALPIEGAEDAKIVCFRSRYGTSVHLALCVGNISRAKTPLVRVHSSCVTGDILGSLRCDCGSQLQLALQHIISEGAGIVVYLHQEGRGIGIANKLRAYALQEQGIDTYEANRMLGFDEDERDFAIAARILKKLGIKECRLLTNNPDKLKNLKSHGIKIIERVKTAVAPGRHNHNYLSAKALKSGHLF
jgi:GTP cyclohydrolase II